MTRYSKPQIKLLDADLEQMIAISQNTCDTSVVDDGSDLDARQTNLNDIATETDDAAEANRNVWN